jgi:tetratricopeptide (TPR) repeat protein
MKVKWLTSILIIVFLFGIPTAASAEDIPYNGYIYDYYNQVQPAPIGYEPVNVIMGTSLGTTNFKAPQDLFIDRNNDLYVLDSGNNRVVVMDSHYQLKKVIDSFRTPEGESKLKDPTGIYVSGNGDIYIADNGNGRVLKINPNGDVLKAYTKPDAPAYNNKVEFKPIKVVVDNANNVYVLVDGLYDGAVVFDDKGEFTGFYGSNRVEMTLTKLADSYWKKLLNKEQRNKMARFVPVAYTNFDIDSRDFVYTTSKDISAEKAKARKLNPSGAGMWEKITDKSVAFGDIKAAVVNGYVEKSLFQDIDVSRDGFINLLDSAKGRIFQYDQSATLMFVFGGKGDQAGTFLEPVAIESKDDDVLVLDSKRGNITVFRTTEFGQSVHKAIKLYNDGQYKEAEQPWQEVIKKDSFYELAYVSLGKAAVKTAEYDKALDYFKLGNNRTEYSKAFEQYRKSFIRTNFLYIVSGLAFMYALYYFIVRKDGLRLSKVFKPYQHHFQLLLHPFEGMNEIALNKTYSLRFSALLLSIWAFVKILAFFYTGFIFNFNGIVETFNLLFILAGTVGLFTLWTISNWSVCTLVDGKGSFKAIWATSAYALMPYLISQIVILIGSNVLVKEEGIFLVWIGYIGMAYSILILFSAMLNIHDFSFKETVWSIAGTVAGIAVMIFILFMAFALYQKVFEIGSTIYNEITLRQ